MARVSAKISLTLKLFKDNKESFEYIRPELEISDINPEGDVKAQLALSLKALRMTYDTVTEEMDKLMVEQMGLLEEQIKK